MGYLAFNKMTIQLPIPSATMTKAEYKEAYGIDLDDLDFAKVTLLVDGKEKYAVDEIKIVSDDVLIYAGGKILTIGDNGNVSVTSDAYSVVNAKPIYYHPITIWNKNLEGVSSCSCSLVILNNEQTAFTTLQEFITWCRNNNIESISPASGSIYSASRTATMIIAWIEISEAKISFRGHDVGDASVYLKYTDVTDAAFSNFNLDDNVNKIN